ncbi:2'-5' RNA ligase family protein [Prochlorococcus sp. MIT 1341]|uniref:2'-5' RNA ligase family protein n=1 Tax=Prochlorococcus sp. MIT 1341 TaxID=3096221 RepID=UPI002A754FA6|nr:2'-5' RNA ligase family protein [Prochlorococcus sp. MIT 1341]
MERITKAFWVWAQFSELDQKHLEEIQDKVKTKLRSVSFPIHITLAGPFVKLEQSALQKIHKFCSNQSPFKVDAIKYEHKKKFFESFFISLARSNKLDSFREEILRINHLDSTKIFSPHISLVYGYHEAKSKVGLIPSLPKLICSLTVNKISIVDFDEITCLAKISRSYPLGLHNIEKAQSLK